MEQRFSEGDLRAIDQLIELAQQVIFWVDVTDDGGFVFRKFSKYYSEYVGIDTDALIGHRPHDILPPRIADTVVRNYEVCRDTAAPFAYEELLEMADRTFWWNTTLSPVLNDEGQVVSIVGFAQDITHWKDSDFQASLLRTQAASLTSRLDHFAQTSVNDIRGPFVRLVSLLGHVTRDADGLGGGKLHILTQCEAIVQHLMEKIDALCSEADGISGTGIDEKAIDLGHLCADLCALVDPQKEYDILFPLMTIETSLGTLQSVLKAFVENAKHYSRGRIEIEASDYGDGQVYFSVYDDGVCPDPDFRSDGTVLLPATDASGRGAGFGSVCDIVSSMGGTVEAGLSEDGDCVELSFSLPGRITRVATQKLASSKEIDLTPGASQRLRLVG